MFESPRAHHSLITQRLGGGGAGRASASALVPSDTTSIVALSIKYRRDATVAKEGPLNQSDVTLPKRDSATGRLEVDDPGSEKVPG